MSGEFGHVSIVMPAYNAARYVDEAVRSVMKQSYTDWDLFVVDDCSSDETCSIVEAIADTDARVKLLRQAKNGGPAAARNRALAVADGRWIAFLDSDDVWLPEKLGLQLRFHESSGADISFTSFRRMSDDGSVLGKLSGVPARLTYKQLLGNTAIVTSTVVLDSRKTGPVSMKQTYYDDFACWLEVLRGGGYAAGLSHDLLRYRVVGGSVSRNKAKSAREVWKTYRDVENLDLLASAWYFANYAARGWLKYRKF